MIHEEANNLQRLAPFVVIRAADDVEEVEGTADEVMQDPNLVHLVHLNARDTWNHIRDYANNQDAEPRRRLTSNRDRQFAPGHVSLASVQPLLTQQQWQNRRSSAINAALLSLGQHVIDNLQSQVVNVDNEEINVCLCFACFLCFVFVISNLFVLCFVF